MSKAWRLREAVTEDMAIGNAIGLQKKLPANGEPYNVKPQIPLIAGALGRLVSGLLRIGFGHVFPLLGLPVPAAAWLVIHAAVGVDPHHPRLWRWTC